MSKSKINLSLLLNLSPSFMSRSLSADDILPREIWLEIAKVYPSAWISLSLVVSAVGAAARDPVKQSALMIHFTDSDGRLPNGERHGKHRCNDGTYYYWKGKIHRDNDKPAAIHRDGSRYWYQHGEFHRDGDQPAVICIDGTQKWYQHGNLHRDGDNPAIIYLHGGSEYYRHGAPIPGPVQYE